MGRKDGHFLNLIDACSCEMDRKRIWGRGGCAEAGKTGNCLFMLEARTLMLENCQLKELFAVKSAVTLTLRSADAKLEILVENMPKSPEMVFDLWTLNVGRDGWE